MEKSKTGLSYQEAVNTIARYEEIVRLPPSERLTRREGTRAVMKDKKMSEGAVKSLGRGYVSYVRCAESVTTALEAGGSNYTQPVLSENTPNVLRKLGLENLPLMHSRGHLRKEVAAYDDRKHHHGIPKNTMKRLVEHLRNPILVFDAPDKLGVKGKNKKPGREVVALIDAKDEMGRLLFVYIKPNDTGLVRGKPTACNFVKTVFGRNALANYLQRAHEEGKILYVNQEKYRKTVEAPLRVAAPQCAAALRGLDGIISQSEEARKARRLKNEPSRKKENTPPEAALGEKRATPKETENKRRQEVPERRRRQEKPTVHNDKARMSGVEQPVMGETARREQRADRKKAAYR